MEAQEEEEEGKNVDVFRKLLESVDSNPDDASVHFNLGVFLWEKGEQEEEGSKEQAAEYFVRSAKLNPQNGDAFRYLGHYYARVSVDTQRAFKCYQRAVTLNPNDADSGEALCDLLDQGGKETLQISACSEASEKSPRAFWAFRRLGYLQLHQNKWSEAVQSLQHAIRGYPTCADLWEALGLAYQRLGMFTAAIKSYGRVIELEDTRIFALVESGNIFLMLGSFRKGIEHFRRALEISPKSVSAQYGLASGLLSLSKECTNLGAFSWGTSLLEEASRVAKSTTCLAGNVSCIWKLLGDIQLAYAKCLPWLEEKWSPEIDEEDFSNSILNWKQSCCLSAISANNSYQRALHLAPWQANIYTDIAISSDLICTLREDDKHNPNSWQLPEKMSLGGLLLEGDNNQFWVTLGCVSGHNSLKQHAFIRGLQLDVSLAIAWACLGKLYRKEGKMQLARQAFDSARSIDPSLALPWAGMSADTNARNPTTDEAYESCLRAVQILPAAEFQIGLAKLALLSGHLSSSQVFGAIQQAVQHAPYHPESHNLNGLICEARCDYQSAVASYRLARYAINMFSGSKLKSHLRDVALNLARSLSKAGNALDAVQECRDLKQEGLLDAQGLQIYAISLWQLGENDLALSVARDLAGSVSTMERASRAASVSFICKFLYKISGQESAIISILKMPKELFENSKISFVVSAIHALDGSNKLESVVSSSRRFLASHEEIARMHCLVALSKLIKQGTEHYLGFENGVHHLRKALHVFPNSVLIRNMLGYLLLSSQEGEDTHSTSRCCIIDTSHSPNKEGLKSALEILGAGAVACAAGSECIQKFSFPTCRYWCLSGPGAIQQLQKWLHREPWNHNARYLLILNFLQRAREERFPRHLCTTIERLNLVAMSNRVYLKKDICHQYQKFQLLLCASEISLQSGDQLGCVNHAKNASVLSLPDCYLFFAHLQLCRTYVAEDDFKNLQQEYIKCLELKTDYCIGWLCLKFMESHYELQNDLSILELNFEKCSKERQSSWKKWRALFDLLQGLISVQNQDFLRAEKFLAQACSMSDTESCTFLCHGVICMELARQQCDSQYLSHAIKSLMKAQEISLIPLPFVSTLLAQAEGSRGSKAKWEKNLLLEWFSWPPELRPAELFLQMHLLATYSKAGSESSFCVEPYQSQQRWVLRAIHLNPSCMRYWKVLRKLMQVTPIDRLGDEEG